MKDKLRVQDVPGHLRQKGWVVAVHNDYKQNGTLKTFWLFTKGNRCAKGEGTDVEAFTQILKEVEEQERDEAFIKSLGERVLKLEAALEPFAKAAEELDRSDAGWDDRARVKNSWFFDDDVIRAASRVLRRR